MFNSVGIPFAIATCIQIMRKNMGQEDQKLNMLRSQPATVNYHLTIGKMNAGQIDIPASTDPLQARLMIKEFFTLLSVKLLPFDYVDVFGNGDETAPVAVVNALITLSPQHLKLFVYIFKFLYDYAEQVKLLPMDPSQIHSAVYADLNGIADCVAPWMFSPINQMKKHLFKTVLYNFNDIFTVLHNRMPKLDFKSVYNFDKTMDGDKK